MTPLSCTPTTDSYTSCPDRYGSGEKPSTPLSIGTAQGRRLLHVCLLTFPVPAAPDDAAERPHDGAEQDVDPFGPRLAADVVPPPVRQVAVPAGGGVDARRPRAHVVGGADAVAAVGQAQAWEAQTGHARDHTSASRVGRYAARQVDLSRQADCQPWPLNGIWSGRVHPVVMGRGGGQEGEEEKNSNQRTFSSMVICARRLFAFVMAADQVPFGSCCAVDPSEPYAPTSAV